MSIHNQNPVVNVRNFKDVFYDLLKDDEYFLLDNFPDIDIGTNDLLIVKPEEQIKHSIERELTKDHFSASMNDNDQDMEVFGITPPESSRSLSSLPTPSEIASHLMLTADVPSYEKLLNEKPEHLHCLRDSEKYEPKSKKREVNYHTPQMQTVDGFEPIDDGEVLLSISFYHSQKNVKTQEYIILGSQCLTELKDKFYCLSDQIYSDITTKSGFFFFENTFYNDMRFHNSIDYSRYIVDWVNEGKRYTQPEFGIFSSKKMEEVTFNDLNLRIGVPYVYCHRGNCEHIILVTEIRLLHETDERNKRSYPLQTFQNKIRRKKCRICDIYPAKWVTVRDELAPENPCFFCEKCYHPFHFDENGNLLYNVEFEAYPYYHE